VRGKTKQRRCPGVPSPVWWDVKQNPRGVWDWEVHHPADWPGSSDSGRDLCGTAPGSAPTRRSNSGRDYREKSEKDAVMIMQQK